METCGTAAKQRMCIARVASYLLQAVVILLTWIKSNPSTDKYSHAK